MRLLAKIFENIAVLLQLGHHEGRFSDGTCSDELQDVGMRQVLPNLDFLLDDLQ